MVNIVDSEEIQQYLTRLKIKRWIGKKKQPAKKEYWPTSNRFVYKNGVSVRATIIDKVESISLKFYIFPYFYIC